MTIKSKLPKPHIKRINFNGRYIWNAKQAPVIPSLYHPYDVPIIRLNNCLAIDFVIAQNKKEQYHA